MNPSSGAYILSASCFARSHTSGDAVWPIGEDIFARIYQSREPFWTVIEHDVKDWASGFLESLAEEQPTHRKQVRPARRS